MRSRTVLRRLAERDKASHVWSGVVSMIECPTAKLCVAGDQFGGIGIARL